MSVGVRASLLNAVEHIGSRALDAILGIVLVTCLPVAHFSALALAQARIAPFLLLMVAPETILYKDYAYLRDSGELSRMMKVLRRFVAFKSLVCVLVAVVCRSWAVLWALSLIITPQLMGPDRELLRISLKLKTINWIGLIYKGMLVLGSLFFIVLKFENVLASLAVWSVFCAMMALIVMRRCARRLETTDSRAPSEPNLSLGETVADLQRLLMGFSGWSHVQGVLHGWTQSMDLWVLGFLAPARTIGLYATALKIANFTSVVPVALGNSFSILLSRDHLSPQGERRRLWNLTFKMATASLGLGTLWLLGSGIVFRVLSRGRYSLEEMAIMRFWFASMVIGAGILNSTLLFSTWFTLRGNLRRLVMRVYLPWILFSASIYRLGYSISKVDGLALGNLAVAGLYLLLIFIYAKSEVANA